MLTLAIAVSGFAQSETSTDLPAMRAPDRSEWTITVERNPEAALAATLKPEEAPDPTDSGDEVPESIAAAVVEKIVVSKQGTLYREVTHWASGRKTEKWVSGGLQVYETPTSKRIARIDLVNYPSNFSDYSRSDFEAAEWIDPANFVATHEVGDRTLLQYSVTPAGKRLSPREVAQRRIDAEEGPATQAADARPLVALIDAASRLPVYVDDGENVRTYQYKFDAPQLDPPQSFRDELDRWREELAEKYRPPTPP